MNRITAFHFVSADATNVLQALVFKGARLGTVNCDQGKISVKDYIGEVFFSITAKTEKHPYTNFYTVRSEI